MKTALLLLQLATPVHEFYSNACCGGHDCHPVPCEEITSVADGWMWQGIFFKRQMLQIPPDGQCHICVVPTSLLGGVVSPHATCIYLPPRT